MKHTKYITTLLLFIFLFSNIFSVFALAADTIDEPDDATTSTADSSAGIGIVIDDEKISNIRIGNWTLINATVVDSFDLNWEMLQTLPFPDWWMKTVWRVQFGIPDIERYLGYTQIRLEPEVITEDGELAEGWSVKIEPSTIDQTTQGKEWSAKIYAKVNRLASDYNPIIRVKCTRLDVQGNYYNESYSYIPIKSVPRNFATIETTETTKRVAPNSVVTYEIKVSNEGEYKEVFQFNVQGKDDVYGLISEQALVLESGQTEYVQLSVLTPAVLFDPGTPREVKVSVYPIKNPAETYSISVNVITEGFFLSPLITFTIGFILLILAFIIYFVKVLLSKDTKKEKPKKKNPENESNRFFSNKIKLPKKSEPEAIKEEPVELEVVKPTVDKKAEVEQRKKQKALEKARKAQEKQRRRQ
jgi:hypothetical protein